MPRDGGACVELERECGYVNPVDDATNVYVGTSDICPTSTGEKDHVF